MRLIGADDRREERPEMCASQLNGMECYEPFELRDAG
ncbi:hypothetical protein MAQ5080_01108 [Marinomonas aquimarina]|uniref:Uncharacterized protein n=1 Tax=Marinomonas aquimarina TaxID=295068 RepID=A0A1A8T828_9GAMM|nr:hypothetical protein MAQ5080_01108 [Marinomonas aquimarina]